MTKAEKRERRQARHDLQAEVRRVVTRRIGLFATAGQIKSGIRKVADQAVSELTNA